MIYADGNHVDSFDRTKKLEFPAPNGSMTRLVLYNAAILALNKCDLYIRGQTTSKGVKIK